MNTSPPARATPPCSALAALLCWLADRRAALIGSWAPDVDGLTVRGWCCVADLGEGGRPVLRLFSADHLGCWWSDLRADARAFTQTCRPAAAGLAAELNDLLDGFARRGLLLPGEIDRLYDLAVEAGLTLWPEDGLEAGPEGGGAAPASRRRPR